MRPRARSRACVLLKNISIAAATRRIVGGAQRVAQYIRAQPISARAHAPHDDGYLLLPYIYVLCEYLYYTTCVVPYNVYTYVSSGGNRICRATRLIRNLPHHRIISKTISIMLYAQSSIGRAGYIIMRFPECGRLQIKLGVCAKCCGFINLQHK